MARGSRVWCTLHAKGGTADIKQGGLFRDRHLGSKATRLRTSNSEGECLGKGAKGYSRSNRTPARLSPQESYSNVRRAVAAIPPRELRSFLSVSSSFFNAYLCLRQSGHEWGRGRERGAQRIQSGLCADSREPDVGLELTDRWITT